MLGFGILMLGMDMMGKALLCLCVTIPGFVHFIEVFSSNPLLGIGIGMIMTVLIQSSSATIRYSYRYGRSGTYFAGGCDSCTARRQYRYLYYCRTRFTAC